MKHMSLCWVALFFFVACVSGRRDLTRSDSSVADSDAPVPPIEQATGTSTSIKTLATERFGDHVRYIPNKSNTFVLCLGESSATVGKIFKPSRETRFFIYHIETETIVFEDAVDATSVSWEDDSHIKVTITPGTVQSVEIQEYGYRYDVISGIKEALPSSTSP